ncbi:unnamed protein product [Moneuplotes crassus]|uniref:Uncharacterized protein n=1 Tax=Euplotes crassus TaxID=5936 RepID=A0AAD1UIP8_EUPCR|nr:unnamed protein product [Moneuplotes crassus]
MAITAFCGVAVFILSGIKENRSKVMEGTIDDVCTTVEELNSINSLIHPNLNKLRKSEFFRIFKVNLEQECPFWEAEGTCITNKCVVDECEAGEVPNEFKMCNQTFDVERNLQISEMSMINSFIPNTQIDEWMKIEEKDDKAVFVNLVKNGHAWTFFNGSHIWDAIYNENCMSLLELDQCTENQVLYKLISGVHANVNLHITHNDFDLNGDPLPPNHERYLERVGLHEGRLENLFFTYSLALKAINNLSGKIDEFSYLSDNPQVDNEVKETLNDLIENSIKICENPFREENMFTQWTKEQFTNTIKPVFYNITRILDCVTCEKCKLYGKLQFTGLTAVMKIMFGQEKESKLTRNEMVGLINLMAKLSDSIEWYFQWLQYEQSYEYPVWYALKNHWMMLLLIVPIVIYEISCFFKTKPKLKTSVKKSQ